MTSKSRVSAVIENATLSINEKILKKCHELYSEEEVGKYSSASFSHQVDYRNFFPIICDEHSFLIVTKEHCSHRSRKIVVSSASYRQLYW